MSALRTCSLPTRCLVVLSRRGCRHSSLSLAFRAGRRTFDDKTALQDGRSDTVCHVRLSTASLKTPPCPLRSTRWRHLLQVPDGMVRSSAASAASGGLQLTCSLDTSASSGSTVDSPPGDGHAVGGGGEAPRSPPSTVEMEARTESQDMAAAADLITTLSRGAGANQGDVHRPQATAAPPPPVALRPPAVSAPRPPPWEGMLPAPDARVASANAPAVAAATAKAAASASAAVANVPAPSARNRSPYARRGSQVPLGDRPPPKPASSVKFSRRNAPYVCQVLLPTVCLCLNHCAGMYVYRQLASRL